MGDDGRLLPEIERQGYAGLVVEALGGGHVPSITVDALEDLAVKMPVILASRTGGGEVLRSTYGFIGSEMDLLERGLIYAGPLDGLKARLYLTLLLRAGATREEIRNSFESWLDVPVSS
jgi:L-asparaginase